MCVNFVEDEMLVLAEVALNTFGCNNSVFACRCPCIFFVLIVWRGISGTRGRVQIKIFKVPARDSFLNKVLLVKTVT